MELNLEPDFIKEYWNELEPKFYQLLEETSSLETWALTNNPTFQLKLKEFNKILPYWKTTDWSKNTNKIIDLMSHMTISQFLFLLHYLDFNFPGLSIHYVMEARHNENSESNKLFMQRLNLVKQWDDLDLIFTPMRKRLISGLLEEDNVEEE